MIVENMKELNIEEYSLDKVTLPPIPARFLEVTISNYESENYLTSINEIYENIAFPFARTEIQSVPIKSSKILTENESKTVIEILIDVTTKTDNSVYLPGDVINIMPQNNEINVNLLLDSVQLISKSNHKCEISIMPGTSKKNAKIPSHLKCNTTPRQLFQYFLNIEAVPKKLLIRSLVDFTNCEKEQNFLKTLCSKEGSDFYTKLINEKAIKFIDILKLCPSCRPPLAILIEHLPRLLPRSYSIANSPLLMSSSNLIRLIFSVRQTNPGLMTSLLANLAYRSIQNPSEYLPINIYYRNINNFNYNSHQYSQNIIMISVGCAIAPFLGFLEHMAAQLSKNDIEYENLGKSWLFTGFRSKEQALYNNELNEFMKTGVLTKHFQCYSRSLDTKYKYVTDAITENQQEFIDLLLNDNTILYVCADGAEISKCIEKSILDCLIKILKLTQSEATDMIKDMKNKHKYREDIWL